MEHRIAASLAGLLLLLPALPAAGFFVASSPSIPGGTMVTTDAARARALLAPLGSGTPRELLPRLAAVQGVTAALPTTILVDRDSWAHAPLPLQPGLARLARGVAETRTGLDAAFAALSPAERAELADAGPGALRAEHALALGRATPAEQALAMRHRGLASLVRMDGLLAAGIALGAAAEEAQPLLPRTLPADPALAGSCGVTGGLVYASPDCSILVGDAEPTTYTRSATLIVDEGGADTYLGSAGGGNARSIDDAPPVSMLLDLGDADDTYLSVVSGQGAAQGAGYLGAGLLLDEGGNDTYSTTARDITTNGRFAAQGSGLDGVGVLWDQGDGADRYTSRNAAQGVGLIGYGLLLDEGGADRYTIPYTYDSEAGQGVGCYGGDGALLDRGTGNDVYDAAIDDMQGMGCIGGLGALVDEGGDDAYFLHSGWGELDGVGVVQSGWGQGYGEVGGLGLLLDQAGDDVYAALANDPSRPLPWEGHHAQGVGLLGGAGLLLDQAGDDTYAAVDTSQGAGNYGAGTLRDESGNDTYLARRECQGWANAGSGTFTDLGGRDLYVCSEPASGPRQDGSSWAAGSGGAGADSGP